MADINEAPETALATDIAGLKSPLPKQMAKNVLVAGIMRQISVKRREHAELCGRCVTNVAGNGEERKFA